MKQKRIIGIVAAAAASLCLVAGQGLAEKNHPNKVDQPGTGPEEHADSRIAKGKAIAPVSLTFNKGKRASVYLGSYLVNAVGGCNDCHTNPSYVDLDPTDGDPGTVNATNYLAGGTSFGPFVSANITPDASGKPAGHTRDEFIAIIRTGYDADESRYLHVMPWPVYRNMTDHDLNAIYDYLTAIPHADPAP